MNKSEYDFSIICTDNFNINEMQTVVPQLRKLITNPLIKIEADEIEDCTECLLLAISIDEDGQETGDCGYSLYLLNGEYQIAYLGVPHPVFEKYEITTNDFDLFIKTVNSLEF